MRFLIFGCNGMAGHLISLYLKEQGHDVVGFARSKSSLLNTIIGDVTNKELVKETIGFNRYDCVINCIGLLNQFAENDKPSAVYLNAFFPHFIAELTKDMDTQIIHMSTDCVFSGMRGQYTEDDVKDGRSFYDRTKALGELDDNKNLTLRNSIVGPDMKKDGIGLMNWFLQQEGEVSGFTKAIWTGQTTLQLAKTMEAAAQMRASGLYNAVPDESISKYELLQLFNQYLRSEQIRITPNDSVSIDKSLKRTRWEFDYHIPDYERMVCEIGQWMRKHRKLYPHYNL